MIITKIIILYFIQIRHTDDFPSTGTSLVIIKVYNALQDLNYFKLYFRYWAAAICLLLWHKEPTHHVHTCSKEKKTRKTR